MDTKIFRSLSYGVYVVGTMDDERPTGCVANSIMQVTSSPATIAVSVNHNNYTNRCIKKSGLFSFSVLSEASDPGLIGRFGFCSGEDTDKFQGVEHEIASGCPVVKDSCGYVVCRVIDTMEASTHTVFLGEVVDAAVYEGAGNPMTYAYYHQVVKGKSPKNAPTYLPEAEEEEKKSLAEGEEEKKPSQWVCQICGYVYEGETLPADFKCPVCRQGADRFVKKQ